MDVCWKKVRVYVNSSIHDVLKIINEQALRVALVVDEADKLVGIVTDGDVRRGLLAGKNLHDPACQVMNRDFITADSNTSRTELISIMEEYDVLSIPLVENGVLVGLETLHHALEVSRLDNPVFIMAGGFGTRLRPLTDKCPKPMLKVGDKPILETLILRFKKSGFSNFYISTHYLPEMIRDHFEDGTKFGVNIRYVHEENPLGTGGALGLLPADIKQLPLVMINGDVLTKVDFRRLLSFHNQNQPCATMCVREYDYTVPFGVVNGDGNKIVSMEEKPTHSFFVNAGIYVIDPSVFNSVPANQKIDMPTLLEQKISSAQSVIMFPIHEYWLDVGRMEDFNKAQIDFHALELG